MNGHNCIFGCMFWGQKLVTCIYDITSLSTPLIHPLDPSVQIQNALRAIFVYFLSTVSITVQLPITSILQQLSAIMLPASCFAFSKQSIAFAHFMSGGKFGSSLSSWWSKRAWYYPLIDFTAQSCGYIFACLLATRLYSLFDIGKCCSKMVKKVVLFFSIILGSRWSGCWCRVFVQIPFLAGIFCWLLDSIASIGRLPCWNGTFTGIVAANNVWV